VSDPIRVVGAAVLRGGRCLVARRGAAMASPGRWEFPGGKVEAAESDEEALVRELAEELGVRVRVGERVGSGCTVVSGRRIELVVYLAELVGGEPEAREHDALRWLEEGALPELDWAEADVPIVGPVRARMVRQGPQGVKSGA
jgi:8-oxo-dGTP diphosphatase